MFVNSHFGEAYIVQLGNEYRVELVTRRTIVFGDELHLSDGRLVLKKNDCVALILENVRLLPAPVAQIQSVFRTGLAVSQ